MNSETTTVEKPVEIEGQGAPSNAPKPFDAAAMVDVIGKAYLNIAATSAKAKPLHAAYIAQMQKAQGYEEVPDLKPDQSKGAKTALKMIADGELTQKGIQRAADSGLIRKIEVKPPQALVDAINKFNGAVRDFNEIVQQATRPLSVTTPKAGGKGRVNQPSNGTRTPSKGYIDQSEWDSISDAEKAQYAMSYDGKAITLEDVNGEQHVCKAISALKRHERGEGHS